MQIIVLGTHRSGSSILTRLLNMMGAYLSPEDKIMRPKPDNPKGFWEREDVYKLNERILKSGGGSWFNVLDFAWDRIDGAERSTHLAEIRDILTGMDAYRPWVTKDPRMCVTFPLWRELLEVPVCVHIYRSPLEIAKSLNKRNGFPVSMGVGLWELYTLHAIEASRGLPIVTVRQADLLSQPVEAVRRLFRDLRALDVRGLRLPGRTEITAFVDPSLYHQRENTAEEGRFLNESQRALANHLIAGDDLSTIEFQPSAGGLEAQRLYFDMERHRAQASEFERRLSEETEQHRRSRTELEKRLNDGAARERDLSQQLGTQRTKAEQMIAQVSRLSNDLTASTARGQDLKEQHQGLEKQNREQSKQIGTLEGTIRRLAVGIQATEESWRWRVGNRAVRLVEVALFRPRVRLAMDQINETLQAAMQQQGRSFQRIADAKVKPDTPASESPSADKPPRIIQFTPPKPRNPFFFMIGDRLAGEGVEYFYSTDRKDVLSLVEAAPKDSIVHFHHLEPLYHPGLQTETAVGRRAEDLLDFLKALKSAGAKLVWTKHNPAPHDRAYLTIDQSFETKVIALMDRVVVLARGAREGLSSSIGPERIAVIPHPGYRAFYGEPVPQSEARARLQLPDDAFILGNLGELKPYKGLERIIAAFSSFQATPEGHNAFLLLAGNPGPKAYLDKLTLAMPENGRLVAKDIPDADIPLWMSALDVAVFAFEDIWVSGSVILALSYERPVLAPDIGFLDEYVDHENTGLLYQAGDPRDLARAMASIATTPYRAHYEYMCRVFEQKHDIADIAARYRSLYT